MDISIIFIRENEFVTELDGLVFEYKDYPSLIGISGELEINYRVEFLSNDDNSILCDDESTVAIPSGIILLHEDFDSLILSPAVDEALGGCTDTIPNDLLGWTHTPPDNWTIDNTDMPESGTLEWRGWSFASKIFWVAAADQERSLFTRANENIAVADSDEWDDCYFGADTFNSILSTPEFSISKGTEIQISFDSHFRK
eukprot:UN29161